MEFPLCRLPYVPTFQIIQLMTTGERIKLALTSRRMEKYLTRMFKNRVPVFDYKVHLRGEKSFLDIYRDDWRLFMTPSRLQYEPHDITDEHAKPWLNEKCTMIDNALNVYTRLQNVFRAQVMNLHVYLDEIEPTPIPKIINHPCVANMTGVHIYGGTVQRCDLDAVMEWKQENAIQFITVGSDNIPSDYRHPNALRFSGVNYCDARWIRLEDLLSMRKLYRSYFGTNNFSMEDLNTFIKYWTNCDEEMFTYLNIEYERLNISELFKDMTVLKGFRSRELFYLISSNSTDTQCLMAIRLVQHPRNQRRKELEFSIQDPNKPHRFVRGNTVPAWTREFSILRKLARKRSLEERITVREESLAKELEDLENELTAEGVRMIDGIMTVQEEL